jgi:peptide-methionine (R)-S-oxide reductase
MKKTEDEWKAELSSEAYRVLREKGTERAFTGKYYQNKDKGIYTCAGCGQEVFQSTSKYDSGCGWPSFDKPTAIESVSEQMDKSHGMYRVEINCSNCGGHLGHKFNDGPSETTGERYCINSAALNFDKKN